ncbi:glutathione S-transferase L3 [Citrus sinensis]|uniref:Glutathione S-transferase L3 n=1 Tax=Citrus sinensis TaxID=2711 RepID=A0ACB8KFC2_CITSI|nr:glutathione S-transferase L3 [Citrus sinensis]
MHYYHDTLTRAHCVTAGFRSARESSSTVGFEGRATTSVRWNSQGLQDKIKLVPLNLQDRPAWYKEKVYPVNKVPALEHNGKVIGESLDLIKYVDSNFEGPSLLPDDPEKRKFADELFSHIDTFTNDVYTSFKGDPAKQAGPAFDYLEKAVDKFDDGPFFLGQTTRQ